MKPKNITFSLLAVLLIASGCGKGAIPIDSKSAMDILKDARLATGHATEAPLSSTNGINALGIKEPVTAIVNKLSNKSTQLRLGDERSEMEFSGTVTMEKEVDEKLGSTDDPMEFGTLVYQYAIRAETIKAKQHVHKLDVGFEDSQERASITIKGTSKILGEFVVSTQMQMSDPNHQILTIEAKGKKAEFQVNVSAANKLEVTLGSEKLDDTKANKIVEETHQILSNIKVVRDRIRSHI